MANRAASQKPLATTKANSWKIRWFLIASIFVTFALYLIPFGRTFAYPLVLLSTLVHEMGHGVAAILVGAKFKSFQMWSDGSGVALIQGNTSRFGQAFVAAGGLVGPAVMAAICFLVAKKETVTRIFLSIVGVLLISSEFLFVRNLFAWIFVGVFAALCLWFAQQRRAYLTQAALVFVALQLALSVFSRMDYLFTENALTAQGLMPSDVTQIANALFLPYWFWGIVCALFSVSVLYFGMRPYLKK